MCCNAHGLRTALTLIPQPSCHAAARLVLPAQQLHTLQSCSVPSAALYRAATSLAALFTAAERLRSSILHSCSVVDANKRDPFMR